MSDVVQPDDGLEDMVRLALRAMAPPDREAVRARSVGKSKPRTRKSESSVHRVADAAWHESRITVCIEKSSQKDEANPKLQSLTMLSPFSRHTSVIRLPKR
jgi:hypothetical protein